MVRVPMSRVALVEQLRASVEALRCPHPVRVAVDGPDAAGKTTLADELAAALRSRGRVVIRASIDDFQRPRAERYRRGEQSPDGYFEDSFDYVALREALLDPLGPAWRGAYRRAVFDYRTDTPRSEPEEVAPDDAVLLLDGVFLLRRELLDGWDLRIFVSAAFDETLRRAIDRDASLFGSSDEVAQRYRHRYIPAQELYFARDRPAEAADLIVHNDDPAHPALTVRRASPLFMSTQPLP